MPVHADLQPFLEEMKGGPPLSQIPIELLRDGSRLPRAEGAEMAEVTDRVLAGVPVRIYRPRAGAVLPVLVYFHGGGFVVGDLDTHDGGCRNLAAGADCLVVAVHYRLAPEHRFPAATDDCTAVARWVLQHAGEIGGDPGRVAVGGDSAGGNLAAVAALRLRDEGAAPLAGQLLVYPMSHMASPVEGSMVSNGDGYFLRTPDITWFETTYLGDGADAAHPHASPLLAKDHGRLPPALVITAEFDPLYDQGARYHAKLTDAGVASTHSDYKGAIHGFFGMDSEPSRRAVAAASAWLKRVFAT